MLKQYILWGPSTNTNRIGVTFDPSLPPSLTQLPDMLYPLPLCSMQLLFDAAAAYSVFMSAGLFAVGPPFFGRTVLVFLLDGLAAYFAVGLLFDLVTLTSVLITTVRMGIAPMAFYDGRVCRAG